MSEILEAVEAGNVQAKERECKTRARRRKWATRHLVRRMLLLDLAAVLFVILEICGLIAPVLCNVLVSVVALFMSLWIGAWLQFMFAEGGLLYVRLK